MKTGILVVSFGTTHPETLEKNITAAENAIRERFPAIPCFRAFTSTIVRRRLKEKLGISVPSPAEALAALAAEGYTHVAVQPTLLLPGEEYDRLRREIFGSAGGMHISLGLPLLWDDRDTDTLVEILRESYSAGEDSVLLAMGHGTSHAADAVYDRLRAGMHKVGMELCTVEGSLDFDSAVNALSAQSRRRVHLFPLLLVAGEHSVKDMAGSGEESLKSRLERAGFSVTYSLQGLGELPAVREMIAARLPALPDLRAAGAAPS